MSKRRAVVSQGLNIRHNISDIFTHLWIVLLLFTFVYIFSILLISNFSVLFCLGVIIPWRACAARDTVVVWSVCRSFVLSVSLVGGSVSVHSASTRTRIAFTVHENHSKLN